MSRTVIISNPIPGGSRFTNRQAAKRYVRRGEAEWCDETRQRIRFHETDKRTSCIANRVPIEERVKRAGYDCAANSGMATLRELANIPVVGGWRLLRGKRGEAA